MLGFDGTGPWGLGPRLGRCLFPGGGLILNLAPLGLGAYAVKRLLEKNISIH